ncbi:Collagen Alpha-5(Vi) Chain [Manis pentadactyla]|nr:Collagen Alpha-5(Vi) Chain [Manis pentadactyla]
MPSSSASVAPVPNAQVPRLRVLVAAGPGGGGGVAGGGGSSPGNPEPRVARVHTKSPAPPGAPSDPGHAARAAALGLWWAVGRPPRGARRSCFPGRNSRSPALPSTQSGRPPPAARLHPRFARRPLPARPPRGSWTAGPAPAHPQPSPGAPHWACSVAWAGWGCEATARALEPGGENGEGGSGAGEEGAAGHGGAAGPRARDTQNLAGERTGGAGRRGRRGAPVETPHPAQRRRLVAASPVAAPGKVTGRRDHFGSRQRMLPPARAHGVCLLPAGESRTRARAPGCSAGEPVQVRGARLTARAGARGPRRHRSPL